MASYFEPSGKKQYVAGVVEMPESNPKRVEEQRVEISRLSKSTSDGALVVELPHLVLMS